MATLNRGAELSFSIMINVVCGKLHPVVLDKAAPLCPTAHDTGFEINIAGNFHDIVYNINFSRIIRGIIFSTVSSNNISIAGKLPAFHFNSIATDGARTMRLTAITAIQSANGSAAHSDRVIGYSP